MYKNELLGFEIRYDYPNNVSVKKNSVKRIKIKLNTLLEIKKKWIK